MYIHTIIYIILYAYLAIFHVPMLVCVPTYSSRDKPPVHCACIRVYCFHISRNFTAAGQVGFKALYMTGGAQLR